MSTAVIGVGSNLGSREALIRAASRLLDAHPALALKACSPLYETAALGPAQPDYLNAAFRVETSLAPEALLALLLRTERRLGRVRRAEQRWGPRSLDLDLLWDERGPVDTPSLHLPHPGLTERKFALMPLLDVAPELAPLYASALRALGAPPPPWSRGAIVEPSATDAARGRSVQADMLVDAVALALQSLPLDSAAWRPGPRATLHRVLCAEPDALAQAFSALGAARFAVDCISVSHCSDSQWKVQFHGTAIGDARGRELQLQVRPGTTRTHRVLVL
jgi:2-amino-4-hydroxy-6-hydroxymethyldihydropteridine diphosphokinase